jgi:fatty-acyl-CoA synthase/benzoate-CoA ligase/fatty acid CoA ligase FadD22
VNVAADLADRARRRGWAARPAFHEGDRVWTHGEVHDLAARMATVLAGRGVQAGDRVLIALPDGISWVIAFLAAARLGAVAVLSNPVLTADEHRFMAEDAEVTLCVTGPELEDRFDDLKRLSGELLPDLARAASPAAASEPVDPHTPLYIQYTSGTTGPPKGVVHRHGDPKAYHDLVGEQVLGIGADDVALSVSKLFFAYGFGNAFAFPLFSGSAAVLVGSRPTPALVGELVARHRVTVLYSVPSAYAALVDEAGPEARAGFGSLRAAVTAGERMPWGLGDRLAELFGAPVLEQIGSTEVGHAFCANGVAYNMPGTVGRAVPGYEVRLRDRAGDPVPDGTEGELWVRGPTVTHTYLNLPPDFERAPGDGWLATRDLACRNPDGTYIHLGRTDDMEMVGGITVSPLEVEEALRGHPAVREVAVVAVPDERGATGLHAFVVPAGAAPGEQAFESELIALARRSLAPFKVPRTVRLVPSLPRTPTGKLRRHLVRQGSW